MAPFQRSKTNFNSGVPLTHFSCLVIALLFSARILARNFFLLLVFSSWQVRNKRDPISTPIHLNRRLIMRCRNALFIALSLLRNETPSLRSRAFLILPPKLGRKEVLQWNPESCETLDVSAIGCDSRISSRFLLLEFEIREVEKA